MQACKDSMSGTDEDPWTELRLTLEAPVVGYFIPQRGGHTNLEIKEFTFTVETEEYDEEI